MTIIHVRLKCVSTINDDVLPETTDPDREITYVDISNVDSTGTVHEGLKMRFRNAPSRARRLVRHGDVIVSTVRTYLRAIAPITKPDSGLVVSTGFAVVRPRNGLDARFAAYALQNTEFIDQVVANSEGVSYPAINPSRLGSLRVPIMDYRRQPAAADYLDSETARIDSLIDRKQRLIDLLLEKRAALITHVVTKGLDPTVEMKDSGVEWIGSIPGHWYVGRLKDLAPFVTSGSRGWAQYYSDEGSLFLRIANLPRGTIDLLMHDVRFVDVPPSAEGARTRVCQGDVLVSITAEMGAVAVAPEGLGEAYVSQHVALLRPKADVDGRWLAYVMSSRVGCEHYENRLYGGTKIQLSLDDVRETPIPIPPRDECRRISQYLDTQVAGLDTLLSKTRRSIDLLREYRTALISAAVTGQIDIPATSPSEEVA